MGKKNGFTMYIDSRRPDLVAAGHSLNGGFSELVNLCANDWAELPDDEKQKFVEKAKSYNERAKGESRPPPPLQQSSSSRKMTENSSAHEKSSKSTVSTDTPIKIYHDDLAMLDKNSEILTKIFTSSGKHNDNDKWMEQPIVICSFSLYAEPGYDFMYLPAEIGLSAMTLKDGVIDNFARVIDPGAIPLGYGIEAIQKAKQLGLPDPGTVREFTNYAALVMTLENFLQKYKGKFPGKDLYVFAFDSDYPMVRRCLEWLYARAGNRLPVKILSIDQYAFFGSSRGKSAPTEAQLNSTMLLPRTSSNDKEKEYSAYQRVAGKSLIGSFIYASTHPLCAAGIFLNKTDVEECIKDVDNYKYFEELCCIYHAKSGKESQNCALNISNRYAYSIIEILTLSNPVKIVKGGHYPDLENPTNEKRRRLEWLKKWGLTKYEIEMPEYSDAEPEVPSMENLNEVPAHPYHGGVPKLFRGRGGGGSRRAGTR